MKFLSPSLFCLLLCSLFLHMTNAQTLELKVSGEAKMEHSAWTMQVRFLPDGQQVVSVDLDGFIRFHKADTGALLREIKPLDAQKILCLEISPDGRRLVTGSNQGKAQLWNAETAKPEREIVADKSIVNAVAFSSDGNHIATGGSEGKIRIWSADSGALAKEINPAAGEIVSLIFSPDGSQVIAGSLSRRMNGNSGGISLWKWQSGERLQNFPDAPGIRALAVSPNGKLIASASFHPTTKLFLLPAGEELKIAALTRALGESDEPVSVAVRESATGRLLGNITAELGATALAFSPDGSLLACAGDHGVILYDLARESLLERGRHDTLNRVSAIAFHQREGRLIIATEKNRLAEFGTGGLEKILSPTFYAITAMARDGLNPGVKITEECGKITGGSTLEFLNAVVRQSAEDARMWEISRRLFTKEDRNRIRADLEKLIADAPRLAEARRLLAVLFESQNLNRARTLLEEAITTDPACVACHRSLADLLMISELWKEAISSYRRALELNPNYGLVRGRLADALGQLATRTLNPDDAKSLQSAVTLLEEAIRLRPTDPLHYSNLASVYFFAGDFDADIRLLEAAIALRPDRARPYYNLGHAWREKGEKKKAISAYKQYVALGEPREEARIQRARKLIGELESSLR